MASNSNNRTAYFSSRLDIAPFTTNVYTMGKGVQSLGLNLSFSLSQVFQLAQLPIYENREDLPQLEVTADKVLDGYCPLYLLSTSTANAPDLAGRSAARCNLMFGIWQETTSNATGSVPQVRTAMASGMYISSVAYNFPVDDNFSESVTWVGNDLFWSDTSGAPTKSQFPAFDNTFIGGDTPFASNGSGGVNRRENILMTNNATGVTALSADSNGIIRNPDVSVFPRDIPGINRSGLNVADIDGFPTAKLQSISVSVDFGREEILQLGVRGPYYRFLQVPTEVTCSIDVLSTSGVGVSATQVGIYQGAAGTCTYRYNLVNNTIRVAVCEGLRLYLGKQNKLTSVNDQGGDTGGGNRTTTFAYSNFNDFTVMHYNDLATSLRPSEDIKYTYLAPE